MVSKTFCPIPWVFQGVRSNGDIRVCCQANVSAGQGLMRNQDGSIFNARNANLEEARNSQLLQEIRSSMLQGKWHPACVRCKQEEDSGLNSRRSYENENWPTEPEDIRQNTGENGEISTEKFPVKYYDLRFGNLCNLSCRMCGPSDSTAWYDDYVKLWGKTTFNDTSGEVQLTKKNNYWVTDAYDWHASEKFWTEISSNLNNVRHIYMAGGEPLLIEKHYDFLQKCVDKDVAKNIILEYNTNLTVLPERAIQLWSHFQQVRIGASIDGFGKVLEYQRYPVKWENLEKNLVKLAGLPKNIFSWLACTVTVYNAFHIPDFIEWKLSREDLQMINRSKKRPVITHHMAHNPRHLNIRVFPNELKTELEKHYDDFKDKVRNSTYSEDKKKNIEEILDSITKYMNGASYYDEHWQVLKDYTNKLDEIRGDSLSQANSSLARYF